MRGLETLFDEGRVRQSAVKVVPKKTLHAEALQLMKEERDQLAREVSTLRLRALQHDKKEARLLREARSATDEAEVLLEAVTTLARAVSNETRSGREVREQARRLLEDHGIPPPVTLGSSRSRRKKKSSKTRTTETP
jgi:hypothetical protein